MHNSAALMVQAAIDQRQCVVGALIVDGRGRVFVHRRSLQRRLFPRCWDTVGGQVEAGEGLLSCARAMAIPAGADPTGIDAYLICGTPRTGSRLLCGLLRSTGVAGRPQSYFRQPDEERWADRWQLPCTSGGAFDYSECVRAAVVAGSTPNGCVWHQSHVGHAGRDRCQGG